LDSGHRAERAAKGPANVALGHVAALIRYEADCRACSKISLEKRLGQNVANRILARDASQFWHGRPIRYRSVTQSLCDAVVGLSERLPADRKHIRIRIHWINDRQPAPQSPDVANFHDH